MVYHWFSHNVEHIGKHMLGVYPVYLQNRCWVFIIDEFGDHKTQKHMNMLGAKKKKCTDATHMATATADFSCRPAPPGDPSSL